MSVQRDLLSAPSVMSKYQSEMNSGHRARLASPAKKYFVSVIVPVRNEAEFIEPLLLQLLDQQYDADRLEVIVADGLSTDLTAEIVRRLQERYSNLKLVANPKRWSSAGRNAALRVACGDVVVIVDGHCIIDSPNYVRDLVQAFIESGADCIGRPQPLDVSGASSIQQAIALARASRLGHQPESFIYANQTGFVRPQSVAVAYRRHVFDTVRQFDESFDACEDVEFNHRIDQAGMRCFFSPRLAVRYYPRASLKGLFRQMVRYGRGRVRLLRKHRDSFTVPIFLPAFLVLGVAFGPLLVCLWPKLGAAYVVGLASYLATLVLTSIVLAMWQRQVRLMPWLPLVFLTIHTGAGVGLLMECLQGLFQSNHGFSAELSQNPMTLHTPRTGAECSESGQSTANPPGFDDAFVEVRDDC